MVACGENHPLSSQSCQRLFGSYGREGGKSVEQHNQKPTENEVESTKLWGIFEGGSISGAIAGLGSLIAAMIHTRALSGDHFLFPKLVSGGSVITGILLHFLVAVSFGIIFAAIHPWQGLRKTQPIGDRAVAAGVLFSTLLWAVMTFGVLPWANPSLRAYVQENPYSWYGYHLIYGTLLLASPILRRRYAVKHSPKHEGPSDSEKSRAA